MFRTLFVLLTLYKHSHIRYAIQRIETPVVGDVQGVAFVSFEVERYWLGIIVSNREGMDEWMPVGIA